MNTYIISDTHFFHKRIQEFEPVRLKLGPDVDAMTWEIVKRWNEVVRPEDTVYHLGDVSFQLGPRWEEVKHVCHSLNGYKILILGNHDRKDKPEGNREPRLDYTELGFGTVSWEPIYFNEYVLSHEPILDTKILNIHGHIHTTAKKHREDVAPVVTSGMHFNASIEELPDFKPMLLGDILKKFNLKEA